MLLIDSKSIDGLYKRSAFTKVPLFPVVLPTNVTYLLTLVASVVTATFVAFVAIDAVVAVPSTFPNNEPVNEVATTFPTT